MCSIIYFYYKKITNRELLDGDRCACWRLHCISPRIIFLWERAGHKLYRSVWIEYPLPNRSFVYYNLVYLAQSATSTTNIIILIFTFYIYTYTYALGTGYNKNTLGHYTGVCQTIQTAI